MKNILSLFIVMCCAYSLSAQSSTPTSIELTLPRAIEIAQQAALPAQIAHSTYLADSADYAAFIASRKWQLNFSLTPDYELYSINPMASSISGGSEFHSLSAGGTLEFSKLLAATGGEIYATSNAAWTEYLGNTREEYLQLNGSPRFMGTTPLRIGYRQHLVGYNEVRWQEEQAKQHYESSKRSYAQQLAQVAENVAQLYFNYASTKALYDMYLLNALSADTLYQIGCRKYAITAISKDELLSLQIQLLNAQNSLRTSRNSMLQAQQSLLSYLNIDADAIDVTLPPAPTALVAIDSTKAYQLALQYNPLYAQSQEEILTAQMAEELARRQKGVQLNLDLSVGVQKYGPNLSTFNATTSPYANAGIELALPVVGHKQYRYKHSAALQRLESSRLSQQELLRSLKENIQNMVLELNTQYLLLNETATAMQLADQSFAQNQYNYAQGNCDINTYTFAQSRKDQAHLNYINANSAFWLAYYRLSTLTLYDFINNTPLK